MYKLYIKFITVAFFITFGFLNSTLAQNGGFAGASTNIGFGPRAISMGNAFSATTSEGIYPYYNPALAAEEHGFKQVDISVSTLDFDRVYQTIGSNFKLPPSAGLSFGLIRSGVQNMDERTVSGYPIGNFNLAEYQLFTVFGLKLNPKVNAGIGIKLNYAKYHPDLTPSTAVGIDIGLLYTLNSQIKIGFAAQDLFANYTWNSKDLYNALQSRNVVNNFPSRYKLGVSYQNQQFSISTEYEIQSFTSEVRINEIFIDNTSAVTIIESTDLISSSSSLIRIGGSWKAHERFTIRSGYRLMDTTNFNSGSFSTGFSVHLPFDTFSPSIDYAFVIEPYNVANMHVFALRLHL